MAENPNSIGQIREHIFGETISQIEQHFKAVEEKIAALEQNASEAGQKLAELESHNAAMEVKIEKTVSDLIFQSRKVADTNDWSVPDGGLNLEELDQKLLQSALKKTNGIKARAAQLLVLTRDMLRYRL